MNIRRRPRTNTRAAAIVLHGLHKSFGAQNVLNGMDLTVGSGKTLAMLGRSGTGKSVLLKLIIGLQQPDSGSIRIHGQELAELGCRSHERNPENRWASCSSTRRSTIL